VSPFALSELLVVVTCSSLAFLFFIFGSTKTHRLFAWFNTAVAGWGIFGFLAVRSPDPSQALFWSRLFLFPVIFIAVFICHMYLTFSPSTLFSRFLIRFSYVQAIAFSLLLPTPLLIPRVQWVFGEFYYPAAGPLYLLFFLTWIFLVIIGHVFLLMGVVVATPEKQRQLKYLLSVSILGFLGGVPNFFPILGLWVYPYGNFLIPLYSLLLAYGLFRHHLLDVNFVLQKTILYSLLVTFISLLFILGVILSEELFKTALGYRSLPFTILVATLVALTFHPLYNWIQHVLDHTFFKGTAESLAREKEKLASELRRTERLRMIGILAAEMAHEIKNPLASIKTFTTYLPEKSKDPVFLEQFKKVVGSEVDKIDKIVKELLDFSKPKSPEMKPVEIRMIVTHCIDLFQNEFSKKRIEVASNGIASSLRILGDKSQLEQAMMNILLNSVESMEEGGELEVTVSKENDFARIEIQDTGKGIPKEDLPYIFDPFFTKKDEGTGLGLAITHRIIEEHKGKISVASEVGKGTTFTVELPLYPA